jgi:ABC-type phosphate transport system permease subunit
MEKKKLLIGLVLGIFIIPLVIALLANAFGFINPGLFGGIAMFLGVGWFIYWAKTNRTANDHSDQPTKEAP